MIDGISKERAMKDSNDCELMNELFDSGEVIHWRPVAIYNDDDTKIRDLTKKEQEEWIRRKINEDKQRGSR